MISEFEKLIYNTYLRISRSIKGQPFTYRRNFDKFDTEKELIVQKLSAFFNKFSHIKLEEFFKAPYEVYSKEETFLLDFYTTQKALKAYTLYTKQLENSPPDSLYILVQVQQALIFIKKYCKQHQISTLEEYINNSKTDVCVPIFLQHLKDKQINIYILFGIDLFEKNINKTDKEVLEFMFGESFWTEVDTARAKFYGSVKCKHLVREGLKKIF